MLHLKFFLDTKDSQTKYHLDFMVYFEICISIE
jgi:hypothetical protein